MRIRVIRYGKYKAKVRYFINMQDFLSFIGASYFMMDIGYVDKIKIEVMKRG